VAEVLGAIVSRLVSDRAQADAQRVGGRVDAPAASGGKVFRIVVVERSGADGRVYTLGGGQVDVGRTAGDVQLEDSQVAARHFRIVTEAKGRVLVPLDRLNGVYVQLRAPAPLQEGDRLLIGKQLLGFELLPGVGDGVRPALDGGVWKFGTPSEPAWARLTQLTPMASVRDVIHLSRSDVVLGREHADIVFSDDEFMSRRHARISLQAGRPMIEDLGSANGTFIRLRGSYPLANGDLIRIGDQLLRYEA
jgi:pSer/pThr/pTyr-binding forkhead associated (FHA) protein